MPDFVNAYSFVPLATAIPRGVPSGHDQARAGLLSGRLVYELAASSPLLVRTDSSGRAPALATGQHFLPGSGVHGALRAVHEALSGSCLRVFDDTFVPAYRSPATSQPKELCVVTGVSSTDGTVTVELCQDRTLVKLDVFQADPGYDPELLRSGARVRVDDEPCDDHGRSLVRTGRARVDSGSDRVVLVSDSGARSPTKPYYLATGRTGGKVLQVSAEVVASFALAAAGTNDERRLANGSLAPGEQVPVQWPPGQAVIGYRDLAIRELRPGQVLWATMAAGRVTVLSLAQIWRTPGSGSTGERVGASVRGRVDNAAPCRDARALCPSCRIFGSADTTRRAETDASVQRSYRGHVRVSDCLAVEPVATTTTTLAPLGAPRPGAGQFYLGGAPVPLARLQGTPARQWGAAPDHPDPRPLRGRKFYWTTTFTAARRTRATATAEQVKVGNMVGAAVSFDVGSTFTGSLTFQDLTPAEVGGLIAALDPRRWAAATDQEQSVGNAMRFRLGGGKPLGYGAATMTVTGLTALDQRARWTGEAAPAALDLDELVTAFVESVAPAARAAWPALAHVLTNDFVHPDLVQYPPAGPRGEVFDFWSQSSGRRLSTRIEPLVQLPDPARSAADQVLQVPVPSLPLTGA